MGKFCKECGSPIEEGVKFCPNCGTSTMSGEGTREKPVVQAEKNIGISQAIGTSQAIGASASISNVTKNVAHVDSMAHDMAKVSTAQSATVANEINSTQQTIMNNNLTKPKKKKSMAIAMILTFFFGPLGMLYTNVKHALIMIASIFVVGAIIGEVGGVLVLIGSLIWTYIDVKKINGD